MNRTITALAMAALISIASGCAESAPPTKTASPVSPTPASTPTPVPAPTLAQLGEEENAQLERKLIQYYTKAKRQRYFDEHIGNDLLLTRYYIHHPTGKQGIVVVVEGLITGMVRATSSSGDTRLYYEIRRFEQLDESEPYLLFVRRALPSLDIDYEKAPQVEGIMGRIGKPIFFPVGLMGIVMETEPVPLQRPFAGARGVSQLPPELIAGETPEDAYVALEPGTGRQLYIMKKGVSLFALGVEFAPFGLAKGGQLITLPVAGDAVLEQIILDTQHPKNRELLESLKKTQPEKNNGRSI